MILWLDDDTSTTLESYRDLLIGSGYDVNMIASVDEAFTILVDKSDKIECVIMDIMMPVGSFDSLETKMGMLTGLFLLKKMQDIEKVNTIPIVIFTIYDENEVSKWARKHNVKYLNKHETTPKELLYAVRKVARVLNN